MPHLMLNCPTCRKRLTYVPLDGLTLHYRCEDHGLLILRPLVAVATVDTADHVNHCGMSELRVNPAA